MGWGEPAVRPIFVFFILMIYILGPEHNPNISFLIVLFGLAVCQFIMTAIFLKLSEHEFSTGRI